MTLRVGFRFYGLGLRSSGSNVMVCHGDPGSIVSLPRTAMQAIGEKQPLILAYLPLC